MTRTLHWGVAALALFGIGVASAEELDLTDPNDIIQATRHFSCTYDADGTPQPTLYYFEGNVWSRRPGEMDRLLFKFQGMNNRICSNLKDETRGLGYRSVSREMILYLDPETGEVADTWVNPWSGEEVTIIHVNNDPVNMRAPRYAYDENGEAAATFGPMMLGDAFMSGGDAATLFYTNPMGGDYQEYVGGTYHASEFGAGFSKVSDVLDAENEGWFERVITWGRMSKWLPWMKMGDRDGHLIQNSVGIRLKSWDDMPEPMKSEIEANWAIYMEPPPLDDDRPNETSWTVNKDTIDAWREQGLVDGPAGGE